MCLFTLLCVYNWQTRSISRHRVMEATKNKKKRQLKQLSHSTLAVGHVSDGWVTSDVFVRVVVLVVVVVGRSSHPKVNASIYQSIVHTYAYTNECRCSRCSRRRTGTIHRPTIHPSTGGSLANRLIAFCDRVAGC